ncbi:MAG: formate dehydrogenase accessory sulfurtransferase FdhD [Gammaproteobacteria bacterium]|nr:formate dehydrogenase accessory sulfurtransferase FdhD [Gammaproteobacteria bacterium]
MTSTLKRGVVDVEALYLPDAEAAFEATQCQVVEEDALTLDVQDVGYYTLMWTPTVGCTTAQGYTLEDGLLGEGEQPEGLALAMGFALSEGLIESLADIKSLSVCPDNTKVVQVQLHHPERVKMARKNVVINSSCGICGPREILEDNALRLPTVADSLRINRGQFALLMTKMREDQQIFQQTGGSHAAAIFDEAGTILAVAEDLGRHNALDKAIGMVLLQRGSVSGCGVVLSSRLSLEMVLKAVRTGLQMMLAVSAPTSLAIEVADKFGVTLCGFVREQRATVYTHPQRVLAARG